MNTKSMQKILAIIILALLPSAREANAVISVIDSANLSNSAKQVASWVRQLEEMKKQLEQHKQQYQALTGNRSLGRTLYNPELRKYLPEDYKTIYDTANGGSGYGISGSIADIANHEKPQGSVADMQKSIEERSRRTAFTNKAVGLKGYEGAQRRIAQIESLMDKINDTRDPKAIAELQARINAEQALLQNETNKLQMISQLQKAEQDLIEEQKDEMNRRILDSKNTQMPRIK